MTAFPIRIADAVAASLNQASAAGSFTLDFEADRRYADWDMKFEDLEEGTTDVSVVYRSTGTIGLKTRGHLANEPTIHVAVRRRFAPHDRDRSKGNRLKNEAVDPLVTLVEEIYEHFAANRADTVLATETEYKLDASSTPTQWVNQSLLRQGLFLAYVEIPFRGKKAI